MLRVAGVNQYYGGSHILRDVAFEVAPNACTTLLGRNGVGKTTTMRSIMGLTPPSAGRVVWRGTDITGWPSYRVARAGIGFVPEDRRIFADLTVWENLDVASRGAREGASGAREGAGGDAWTIERVFDLFPNLRALTSRNGGFLSGGEQQMLTIARTLMGNPELLLLDEPSEGLAPLVVDHLREQIARLQREGLTILLAEQNVDFSLALADRVYVLEKGQIRFSGSAAALRDNEALRHDLLAL